MQITFLFLSSLLAGLLSLTHALPAGAAQSYQVSAWTFGDNDSLGRACDRNPIDEVDVDWYFSRVNGRIRVSGDQNLDFVLQAHARGLRVLEGHSDGVFGVGRVLGGG